LAGNQYQHENSIILNATAVGLDSDGADRFYVDPIRNDATPANVLFYNTATKEITYGTAPTGGSGFATQSYVDTAISNLVASAPSALNTLKELSDALGADANFATTITNALASKAPLASPTFTGTVSGITATMVGLGNVTNESKATMFTSPAFTTPTITGATVMKTGSTSVADEYVAYLNTATTTANQVLDTLATSSYTSVKYVIEAINSTGTEMVEVAVTYSGTSPYINATTLISTVTPFQATYDADVTGGNLRLLVTPTNTNTKFKVRATAFKVI
jgi:hypothetical protein